MGCPNIKGELGKLNSPLLSSAPGKPLNPARDSTKDESGDFCQGAAVLSDNGIFRLFHLWRYV